MTPVASLRMSACLPVLSQWLLVSALALVSGAAAAEGGDAEAQAQAQANQHTRAELKARRVEVQKAYDNKVKECRARFVVTNCLEEAQAWRIEALHPIQRQEKDVNALERQQRAKAQRERILEKDKEGASQASRHGTDAVKAAAHPASEAALPPSRTPRANPVQHLKQVKRAEEQAERKAADRRHAAADRRDQQVEQQKQAGKQAEKRAGKASDPKRPAPVHLPTPSASDIQSLPAR